MSKRLETIINRQQLIGFNVTRPYKTKIIQYLDQTDKISQKTNSVNTVFVNHFKNSFARITKFEELKYIQKKSIKSIS